MTTKRIIAIIAIISVGGVVAVLNQPIDDVAKIPNTPIVGIVITDKATAKNVKAVLDEVKKRGQVLYVDASSKVSVAVKKELKKHSYTSEMFRYYTVKKNDPVDHISKLIEQSSSRVDYAILVI